MAQMVKASACNAGDLGLIPGSGRLGNGNPLQYSCLENPMDGGAWWATVHGVAKTQTWLRDFTFRTHPVDCRTHWILRPCSTRVTVPGSYPQPINTLLTHCIHQWKVILYPLCKWASPWCPGDKRQLKCCVIVAPVNRGLLVFQILTTHPGSMYSYLLQLTILECRLKVA